MTYEEDLRRMVAMINRASEYRREIVASSRCVNCGKPILKRRAGILGDGWLHPIQMDAAPDKQRWSVFCYKPPQAEPEPGWEFS